MGDKIKIVHLFNYFRCARYPTMISQGLWNHPGVEVKFSMPFVVFGKIVCQADDDLVGSLLEADYIFRPDDDHFGLVDVDRFLDERRLWGKVVYYDLKDSASVDTHRLETCLAYVKRSWRVGYDRAPLPPAAKPMLPMDFGPIDQYFAVPFPEVKDIDVAYLFPPNPLIGRRRYNVYAELERARRSLGVTHIGSPTAAAQVGRRAIYEPEADNPFLEYMAILKRAKIVFTAFPDPHDGDSRTWEAFCSRALVFMDATGIPSKFPYRQGRECIVYDARDRQSVRQAIALARYYMEDEAARAAIAEAGFRNTVLHHKPTDRVQRILDWLTSPTRSLAEHVSLESQAPFLEPPLQYRFAPLSPCMPRPAFLGLGAQKAGTSWIDRNLRVHPEIYLPEPKELHFFDQGHSLGTAWYQEQYVGAGAKVCGEITPAYAMLREREVEQIAALLPDLKAFLVVRNPIERAWSAARMDLHRLADGKFDLADIPQSLMVSYLQGHGTMARSEYMATIRRWGVALSDTRFRVLLYDDLVRDPEGFMRSLFAFLDVRVDIDLSGSPIHERVRAGVPLPMPPRIRDLLREMYEDSVRELARYLRIDLSSWLA